MPDRREPPKRDVFGAIGIARRAGHAAVGTRAVREAARARRLRAVLVASDAAPSALDRLGGSLANAPVWRCGDREALGAAVGRGPVAVVGITDAGLARRIERALGAGDAPSRSAAQGQEVVSEGQRTQQEAR